MFFIPPSRASPDPVLARDRVIRDVCSFSILSPDIQYSSACCLLTKVQLRFPLCVLSRIPSFKIQCFPPPAVAFSSRILI